MTLGQVLLTTKTQSNWLHLLLLLINQVGNSYDSCIEALYCKENQAEVAALICFLLLFTMEHFEPEAWQWFTSAYKSELEEYEWNAESGQVQRRTADDASSIPHLYDKDAPCNWETLHNDKVVDSAQEKMVFDLDKNFSLLPCLGSENTNNAGSLSTGTAHINPGQATTVLARCNARGAVSDPVPASIGTQSPIPRTSVILQTHMLGLLATLLPPPGLPWKPPSNRLQ